MTITFSSEEDNNVDGIITGYSYYKEVHISDLIMFEQYRKKHIGSKLVETVEKYYKNKGFENMNLITYNFQAPEFYKNVGLKLNL